MRALSTWTAYAVGRGLIDDSPHTRGNKYGAVRTIVDGMVFASKKEAAYYEILKLRQQAGEIEGLTLQPSYPLHIMEIWRSGAPIRITTIGRFTADFEYLELMGPARGEIVTLDVKSPATKKGEAYRLRKKLVEAIHGLTVTEV
jgi:hypothetical protein